MKKPEEPKFNKGLYVDQVLDWSSGKIVDYRPEMKEMVQMRPMKLKSHNYIMGMIHKLAAQNDTDSNK